MFWQGGFSSRQVHFYVNVGNSFAPHINAPGGNGGLHVSYSLFWDEAAVLECSILPLHNLPVCMHACLSIYMKSAWKIEWNALLCIHRHTHNEYIGNIFFSICLLRTSCELWWSVFVALQCTDTYIDDIRFESKKKNSSNTHTSTYAHGTGTINFQKWLIGVKLSIGQGCIHTHTKMEKSDF